MTQPHYIWNHPDWPNFIVQPEHIGAPLAQARMAQGLAQGMATAIGLGQASLTQELWVNEALATAGIEGERLNMHSVRSSVQRRLGGAGLGTSPKNVDGLVEVMHDATHNTAAALTHERLWAWQAALFPDGRSGLARITTGAYRQHQDAMQIVSGRWGKEVVHYTAPASADVPAQMDVFLRWFADSAPGAAGINTGTKTQPKRRPVEGLVRAAIAHLWFESIHPFEDGNGRLGRAICDLALTQDSRAPQRLYSLSSQLLARRAQYYQQLGAAQHGDMNVTVWVVWFVRQLEAACRSSCAVMQAAIDKAQFWQHAPALNERQSKVVRKLLDLGLGGFKGGLTAEKYIKLTRASKATATRDLSDLADKGVLAVAGIGRGTHYELADWHGCSAYL